jgi:hypothetical protein
MSKDTAQLELTGGIPTGEAHGTHIVTSGEVIEIPKAPPPQEPLTPLGLVAMAISENADVDKLERLLDLQERFQAGEARKEYYAAMREVQQEVPAVYKDRKNEQTNSTYATYDAVHVAIVPIYTKHGFSVSHDEQDSPHEGETRFRAIVRHVAGHSETFHIDLPLDNVGIKGSVNKTKIHAKASSASYAKRILEARIFGVACKGEDNDGNGAADMQITPAQEKEIGELLAKLPERRQQAFFGTYEVSEIGELSKSAANEALPLLRKAVREL